jgi:uncharacterized alpha-E superfamily protein
MLSRAAEGLYWMARYLERAENTARLVSVCTDTRLDHPDPAERIWEAALGITGATEDFGARGLECTEPDVAEFLLSEPQSPASLLNICARARENNRTLLEILPRESWEEINELHQLAAKPGVSAAQRRGEHLREVIGRAQAMAGLFLGAMNDDEAYAFLRLGRAIERGDFGARAMLGHLHVIEHGADDSQSMRGADWVGVLRSLTAFQMYRRSVQGPVTGLRVVRFLTCSTVFPRSLAYCANEAEQALARLPASGPVAEITARLSSKVVNRHSASGIETDSSSPLAAVQAELTALHDMITAEYFMARDRVRPGASRRQSQTA